ncbi:hypothetical protein GCM10009851_06740 [Herbiconiux moechotypicola]|uniref:Fluoride-specific ion channel FluC n=1 Tax=Herbiconiux moechotypicola TaxID=637393 RepID=A0ABN3D9X8_9MICO
MRPGLIALVAAGGVVGTALREAVVLLIGPTGDFPLAIFLINVVGAFVLGALLVALAGLGDDTGRRRLVRLGVGTGVLGGFTTYSALSTDTAHLLSGGGAGVGVALVYGLLTVLVGGAASWLGMFVGGYADRRLRARVPVDPDEMPEAGR